MMSVTAVAFYVKLDAGTLILAQLPGYYFRAVSLYVCNDGSIHLQSNRLLNITVNLITGELSCALCS